MYVAGATEIFTSYDRVGSSRVRSTVLLTVVVSDSHVPRQTKACWCGNVPLVTSRECRHLPYLKKDALLLLTATFAIFDHFSLFAGVPITSNSAVDKSAATYIIYYCTRRILPSYYPKKKLRILQGKSGVDCGNFLFQCSPNRKRVVISLSLSMSIPSSPNDDSGRTERRHLGGKRRQGLLVSTLPILAILQYHGILKLSTALLVEQELPTDFFLESHQYIDTTDQSWLNTGNSTPPNTTMDNSNTNTISLNDTLPEASRPASSPYAYAFIVGGIHEENMGYRGFLYNIMVSVELLRDEFNSTADFVVISHLSSTSSLTELPPEDVNWMNEIGIRVVQVPKAKQDSFSDLMFEKFCILKLVDYRRVIYLDSDIMPVTSLDYMFHLSDPMHTATPTILQPHVMRATYGEPANGGFFMVQPSKDSWYKLQHVIERQRKEGRNLPFPHFDKRRGWGHDFSKLPHDCWHATGKNGSKWNFYGAHVDQGLIYCFMRFVIQNVSHILGSSVENWAWNVNDSEIPYIAEVLDNPFWEIGAAHPPILQTPRCKSASKTNRNLSHFCYPPHRDFIHFTGSKKPWQNQIPRNALSIKELNAFKSLPRQRFQWHLWFWSLDRINRRLDMGLNLTAWDIEHLPHMQESPLGYQPLEEDNAKRIFAAKTR